MNDDVTISTERYGETIWPSMGMLRGFISWNFRWNHMILSNSGPANILDVGGGAGAFALVCKATWPNCHITVLEPSQDILPYLHHNIGDMDDVEILEFAASNTEHTALISDPPPPIRPELGRQTLLGSGENGSVVQCYRLDDVIDGPIDIIKIDVEGHEVECIEGAVGILENYHPDVIVEVKAIFRGTEMDPRPMLEKMGYVLGVHLDQDFFYGYPK